MLQRGCILSSALTTLRRRRRQGGRTLGRRRDGEDVIRQGLIPGLDEGMFNGGVELVFNVAVGSKVVTGIGVGEEVKAEEANGPAGGMGVDHGD